MKWIAVADQEPPKDRVILVTSGFAWAHKDTHFEAREGRDARPAETFRTWNIQGHVAFAIWLEGEKEEMWIEAGRWARLPSFTHWCETENPFGESAVPPRGLKERFEGDARLAENGLAVTKQEEWIANLERHKLDPRATEMGNRSTDNQLVRARAHLETLRVIRDRSYDPYPVK